MIRKLVTLVLALGFVATVNAQESRHEIRVGIGYLSTDEFANTFTDILGIVMTDGLYNPKTVGGLYVNPHVSYKYKINRTFSVGSTFVYTSICTNLLSTGGVVEERESYQFFTLAVDGYVNYLQRGRFKLYGTLGVGCTMINQRNYDISENKKSAQNQFHLNFQVSPIGVQFGDMISGFLELGFGYKGIVSAGVAYRF